MARTKFLVAVDSLVFGVHSDRVVVALIQRLKEPYRGEWALPGGFVEETDPSIEAAARRELIEETNIECDELHELRVFGEQGRDPRDRIITVPFFAFVNTSQQQLRASADAGRARWFPIQDLPRVAFDHKNIIDAARDAAWKRVLESPHVLRPYLPPTFSLRQLHAIVQLFSPGRHLDRANFRKWITRSGTLEAQNEWESEVSHRPARFYRLLEAQKGSR